jgi:hypothetical protein
LFNFKKVTVGLLVIGILAACDNELDFKNELVDTPQQNEVQDSPQQNTEPSYDAPRYHMTGGWTNGEYYIMINGSSDIKGSAKYILQKIPKKGKEKVVKHMQLVFSLFISNVRNEVLFESSL